MTARDTLAGKLSGYRSERAALQPEAEALARRIAFRLEEGDLDAAHREGVRLLAALSRLRELAARVEGLRKAMGDAEGESDG